MTANVAKVALSDGAVFSPTDFSDSTENTLRIRFNPCVHFKLNTPDADSFYITVRELQGFDYLAFRAKVKRKM